ncbi:MAG: TVP38/TMEM64 family protein [Longispora sp.]|nr:TVP38/TMEM64 family protein [Longispora sp. (in: high G+C Gram-positive bacteria)]
MLHRPGVRFALPLAVLVVLGVGMAVLGVPDRGELVNFINRSGTFGPFVAVLGVTALILIMVPRTVLAFFGGLLFGTWAGGGYVLLGALIGASLSFMAGRRWGRQYIVDISSQLEKDDSSTRSATRRFRQQAARLDGWLNRRGVIGVLTVRLVPIAPYGVMSYAFGASATKFRDFLLGSALGAAPSSLAYAAVGAAVLTADPMTLALGVTGVTFLILLGLLGGKRIRTRLRDLI